MASTASTLPIDFVAEETELYSTCTHANVEIYKWFSMFQVECNKDASKATVRFGKLCEDTEVPIEVAIEVKKYVKEQRRAIRTNPKGYTPQEGRQKIFWLLTMFIQHGVFADAGFGKVQLYATFVYCQTEEPKQLV